MSRNTPRFHGTETLFGKLVTCGASLSAGVAVWTVVSIEQEHLDFLEPSTAKIAGSVAIAAYTLVGSFAGRENY